MKLTLAILYIVMGVQICPYYKHNTAMFWISLMLCCIIMVRHQNRWTGEPEELPSREVFEKLGYERARVVWEYLILPQCRSRLSDCFWNPSQFCSCKGLCFLKRQFLCVSVSVVWSYPRTLLHIFAKATSLLTVVVKIKNYIPEIGPFPNNILKKSKQRRYHT